MRLTVPLLAVTVAALAIPQRAPAQVVVEFDRFDNTTTVSIVRRKLSDEAELGAFYIFKGQKQLRPARGVVLHFVQSAESWRYLHFHAVAFLLDGKVPVSPREVDHDGRVGTGYVTEHIMIDLPPVALPQFARAKTIEMRVGLDEFTLGPAQLRDLRDLIAMARGQRAPTATNPPELSNEVAAAPLPVEPPAVPPPMVRAVGAVFPYPGYLNNAASQIGARFTNGGRTVPSELRLEFTVNRSGYVVSTRLLKGSGSAAIDGELQRALSTAAAARAFGPLPAGYPGDSVRLVYESVGSGDSAAATLDAYYEHQVETAAVAVPGNPAPEYPAPLRQLGVEGRVLAQFVVDSTGSPDIRTFKVLESTHELFTDAVRETLPHMLFFPAEIGGRRVRQVVQRPFVFAEAR